MSLRAFLLLLIVTVTSVALAAFAVVTRDVPVASLALNRPLLPALAGRVEEIAAIRVRTAERSMTARRTEDGWVLAEAGDYPVDPEQVRGIVLGLVEMRLLEAKTEHPEKLARLELEPVEGKGARSRLVTLQDAHGNVLAEVVLGKRKFSLYGPGKAGMYVRLADSNQAWLADRTIDVPDEPLDWLERKILDLSAEQIAELVLQPGTSEEAILRRDSPDQKELGMVGLPAGRELDADKVGRLSGIFGTLSLLDVARSEEKQLPEPLGRTIFRTFQGPTIEVAVSRLGEGDEAEWWLALSAYEDERRVPAAQQTAAQAPSAHEAAEAKPTSAGLDIAALQKRFAGRVFKASRYIAERFAWKREDLLKPVAEEKKDGAS